LRAVADGIGFGGESLRIDFDIAGAEQALESAARGVIEGLAENEGAGLIRKSALAGLFLELRRFSVGAAQGEESDDVRLRQRRLGTVVEVEASVGRTGKSEIELVVADVSGCLEIELRFNGNRIGKVISPRSSVKRVPWSVA
jgi:hypothetical protein